MGEVEEIKEVEEIRDVTDEKMEIETPVKEPKIENETETTNNLSASEVNSDKPVKHVEDEVDVVEDAPAQQVEDKLPENLNKTDDKPEEIEIEDEETEDKVEEDKQEEKEIEIIEDQIKVEEKKRG